MGLNPGPAVPVECAVGALKWGALLGEDAVESGVDVCVSSWNRPAPNTTPAAAKATGNYLSSQLISGEAERHGYAEGIGLAIDGTLSEGAGENLFVVHRGVVYTPPQSASLLAGITRDTVLKLCQTLGIEVREQTLSRESLYLADEAFFTGTAAEITPIRSIDGIKVKSGGRGLVTRRLQQAFFGLFSGVTVDRWNWLEPLTASAAIEGTKDIEEMQTRRVIHAAKVAV